MTHSSIHHQITFRQPLEVRPRTIRKNWRHTCLVAAGFGRRHGKGNWQHGAMADILGPPWPDLVAGREAWRRTGTSVVKDATATASQAAASQAKPPSQLTTCCAVASSALHFLFHPCLMPVRGPPTPALQQHMLSWGIGVPTPIQWAWLVGVNYHTSGRIRTRLVRLRASW